MPEFMMDREGTVLGMEFEDLSEIVQGYIECMLFTNTSFIPMTEWHDEESQEKVREGESDGELPNDAGFGDIHPDSLVRIIADCTRFEAEAADLLREAYETGYEPVQAGRDFWYDRNGHGIGFRDRDELEGDVWESHGSPRVDEPGWDAYAEAREQSLGRKLSDLAQTFGSVDASFSDAEDDDSPTGYGFIYVQ